MDFALFITILGTIATIIFGALSVVLYKRKKYPGKISFIKLNAFNLFDSIVKNFNEISILHNKQPIKENIIYFSGCFVNNGDIDIDKQQIEKNISITLPQNFKWLKCIITRKSNELNCSPIMSDPRNLDFELGLFRRNEFFEFEALIEEEKRNENKMDMMKQIEFIHRIADTQKIQSIEPLSENQLKQKKFGIKSYLVGAVLMLLIITVALILDTYYLKNAQLHYLALNQKGKMSEFSIEAKSNNIIELKEVSGDTEIHVSLSEFRDKQKYIPVIYTKPFWQKISTIVPIAYILLVLYILYSIGDYLAIKRTKRLLRILGRMKE
jgi:hypothetical protein